MTKGDEFRIAVDTYLRGFLSKGVPSTFVSLKYLYNNPEKRQIIQDLAESYLASLKIDSNFPSNRLFSQPNDTKTKPEPPTTLLWTLYFLSLHYSYPKSQRDIAKSLEYIEEAIQHTPTLVELYLTKARFLKYQNNLSGAVDAMMEARELDRQDRFVNTKVGKYLLRCDRNDEALQILKEFTRVLARRMHLRIARFAGRSFGRFNRHAMYLVRIRRRRILPPSRKIRARLETILLNMEGSLPSSSQFRGANQ